MASFRETLVDDVVSSLKNINGTGIYTTTVHAVIENEPLPDAIEAGVHLTLEFGEQSIERRTKAAGTIEQENNLPITIVGSFKGANATRKFADRLLADIEQALFVDRRRGLKAQGAVDTLFLGHGPVILPASGEDGIGRTETSIQLWWVSTLGSPNIT